VEIIPQLDRQTDRETDRRTDGQTVRFIRLAELRRGKNVISSAEGKDRVQCGCNSAGQAKWTKMRDGEVRRLMVKSVRCSVVVADQCSAARLVCTSC